MRNEHRWAIAVRTRTGAIQTEVHDAPSLFGASRLARRALVRGVVTLAEAIGIGIDALRVSIRVTTGTKTDRRQIAAMLGVMAVSILILFVAGPAVAVAATRLHGVVAAACEAAVRLVMLVVYLALVGRTRPAAELFAYHGAEHKVIGAFERLGRLPDPDEARPISPVHDRCGTSFAALFVIAAGVLFTPVPREPLWAGALLRILLVPLVVSLAYELMRISARERTALWARALTWPGQALQRLTTREPDDGQVAVARAALQQLLTD